MNKEKKNESGKIYIYVGNLPSVSPCICSEFSTTLKSKSSTKGLKFSVIFTTTTLRCEVGGPSFPQNTLDDIRRIRDWKTIKHDDPDTSVAKQRAAVVSQNVWR